MILPPRAFRAITFGYTLRSADFGGRGAIAGRPGGLAVPVVFSRAGYKAEQTSSTFTWLDV